MEQPTDAQIAEMIAVLEDRAPKIPQYTVFGDNNREKIDMQIRVLREYNDYLDLDDMFAEFGLSEDDDRELYDAARDAWDWCDGEYDETDGKFEDTWANLAGA